MSEETPLKVLCLHGTATNADILKAQIADYIKYLGDRAEFDFVEAPFAIPKEKTPEFIKKYFGADVQTFEN